VRAAQSLSSSSSIRSVIFFFRYAITGAIERMRRHIETHCGRSPRTLVTGGAGWKVSPYLDIPHELVDALIFDGLLVLQAEFRQAWT
jgi:pantothenate kinase type III